VIKIKYSEASINDLNQIGDYIAGRLSNPVAALNTVNKILDAIDRLSGSPLMGASLSSVAEIETDYRFLVCGKYLAFYRAQENEVFIDRILYGKRDYLTVLFGDLTKDE